MFQIDYWLKRAVLLRDYDVKHSFPFTFTPRAAHKMESSMYIWGYISVAVYLQLGVKSWDRMWQMAIVVYYRHGMDLETIPWRELRKMISFLPGLLISTDVHCKSFFFL